jgi:alpha-glucosidase
MTISEYVQNTIIGIRRVGLGNTLRTLRCTLQKARQDRQIGALTRNYPVILPGDLASVDIEADRARFLFDHATLEIVFLAPDLARLSWEPGIAPLPYGPAKKEWPQIIVSCVQSNQEWILKSDELTIRVHPDGSIRFFWPSGELLRADRPPEHMILQSNREDPGEPPEGEAPHVSWTHISDLPETATISGLGERSFPLNLRGRTYRLWNRDPEGGYRPGDDPLYLCLPVYLALQLTGAYLIFYENPFPGSISLTDDRSIASFEDGMLRYYFIPGPPDRALERYSELTGRPSLPPKWSLGYHQSRWGYKTEGDIREVVRGFQKHDLPLSAIHMDIDYMDGFRVFTVDQDRFPDLPGLTDELARKGIRTVMILDPGVRVDPNYEVYREGIEGRHFCTLPNGNTLSALVWPGWSAFPDFTESRTRSWWGSHYKKMIDWGAAGIWHDMNEPASFTAWGDLTLPLTTCHSMEGRKSSHREAHNLYGLLMNEAGFDALRKLSPKRRPWLLSRSGWVGTSRYAWNWTGDTESSWEMLRQTIATILGLGLSGIQYSGPDIGGFGGAPSAELYIRWFQMAAFMPFFRTHSALGTPPREPWRFDEKTLDIARKYLQFRYRLMPYLYTLAWEASQTGFPLARPLFWPQGGDPSLWGVDDSFLLGTDLLVAPVLEPGASKREVTLPAGVWYNFWTADRFEGPARVDVEAPLEVIPLFARGGSLIPLEEDGRIMLHFYAAPEGENNRSMYSDAGDGYGPSRIDRFETSRSGDRLTILWKKEGAFPFPYEDVSIVIHGIEIRQAFADGEKIACNENLLVTNMFNELRIES